MNKPAIIIYGPQGSGKSTQGERLAAKYGWVHFEMGFELRQLAQTDENVHLMTATGQIVPIDKISQIIHTFAAKNPNVSGFVFDGFPRNLDQAQLLDELAAKYGWAVIGVYIHLSDQSALKRLAGRVISVNGQEVAREDDQPDLVKKRLATFKAETLPITDFLAKHYQLITIDGEPPMDEVTQSINAKIAPLLNEN